MNHGWLCTGEDIYKAPWFYISYEIVRKAHFNSNKATKVHLRNIFIHQALQNIYTQQHAHLHFNALQHIHFSSPLPDVLHCNTDTQYISSIPFSTHHLQHIHQTHVHKSGTVHSVQHIHHTLVCCLQTLHIHDVQKQCMMCQC